MPQPSRTGFQWPSAGERSERCTLQYSTPTPDGSGGRGEPTWTDFGKWWAKVATIPIVPDDITAVQLYQAEGPFRQDMLTYFTGGVGLRIVTTDLTLKVMLLENPLLRKRSLVAHCANAVNTQ